MNQENNVQQKKIKRNLEINNLTSRRKKITKEDYTKILIEKKILQKI